jgi:hypothetical protein
MFKFLLFTLLIFSTQSAFAVDCPNLSGRYWDVPGEKPNGISGGTLTEIVQTGCSQLEIFRHWVDAKGKIYRKDTNGYKWILGERSEPCGYDIGVDCRRHPYTQNVVTTLGKGTTVRFPFTSNSPLCSYTEWHWSLDQKKNIVETTPASCEDGFSGDLQRTLERVP